MRILTRIGILLILLLLSVLNRGQPSSAATCPAESATKGFSNRHIVSSGLEREYWLFVPKGYQTAEPTPLVISIHGFTSNSQQQATISKWHLLADQENILVAYPLGTGVPTRWNAGNSSFIGASKVDDVQYFRDLITDLNDIVCLDPDRIFVNGLSNGGGMSNRLACQASDLVAAIGGVAGAYSPVECQPTRPVPVIAFHGTTDPVVAFEGNSNQLLPAIEEWAQQWAERNGCALNTEVLAGEGDVSGIRYGDCDNDAEVILYVIDDGGHTWPGGPPMPFLGKTSTDIDATQVMWEFFQLHPMPAEE